MKFFIEILVVVGVVIGIVQPFAFAQYYMIHHTTLVLYPIPRTLQQGDQIIFSGYLLTSDGQTPLPNRTIWIDYDSPYDCTRILTSTTTDSNGNFTVDWTAKPKGYSGGTYNIFAKFNGDDDNFWSLSKQYVMEVIPKSVQNGVYTVISNENVIFRFGPCG